MSLDVWLEDGGSTVKGSGIFIRENGSTREIARREWEEKFLGTEPVVAEIESEVWYSGNITHNLGKMAREAGIYMYLWRPDELGITHAKELIDPLRAGLLALRDDPEHFKTFNPPNGWGDYDGLVRFVSEYLAACEANPECTVRTWR